MKTLFFRRYSSWILLFAVLGIDVSWLIAASSSVPREAKDFPVGVLSTKGEVEVEGRLLMLAGRKTSEPLVYSGNRISVVQGNATLELLLGGKLRFCQGSRLSVHQNHSPYLIALEAGALSFDLPDSRGDTFFTPDFLVRTETAIKGSKAPFKGELSLSANGELCVRSLLGVLQIYSQANQRVLSVSAGNSIRLMPGEIRQVTSPEDQGCFCESLGKTKDLAYSFNPPSRHFRLLRKTGGVFKKLFHLFIFGLK
jgi:hypothetical protein